MENVLKGLIRKLNSLEDNYEREINKPRPDGKNIKDIQKEISDIENEIMEYEHDMNEKS